MCSTNNVLLAGSGPNRSVMLDHRGVVHLIWDEVSIRLRPSEFMRVERLLEAGVVELELTKISDGRFFLTQPELGEYRLGLSQIELGLSLKDFLDLVKLAYTAARQLNCDFDQPVRRRVERVTSRLKNGRGYSPQQLLH